MNIYVISFLIIGIILIYILSNIIFNVEIIHSNSNIIKILEEEHYIYKTDGWYNRDEILNFKILLNKNLFVSATIPAYKISHIEVSSKSLVFFIKS